MIKIMVNSTNNQNYQSQQILIITIIRQKVILNIGRCRQRQSRTHTIRYDRYDSQNTKISVKTYYNRLLGWGWLGNTKLKFEIKQGKTKLSINKKLMQGYQKNKRYEKNNEERQADLQFLENLQLEKKKSSQLKYQNRQSNNNSSQNLDISFSTAYENSKLNLRIKDKDQINFKLTYLIDLIPQTLTAQVQSLWEFRNRGNITKHGLEFMYTNGLKRQLYERGNLQKQDYNGNKDENKDVSLKKTYFHKNETKIKTKLSDHADMQIKVNSINHFGQLLDQSVQEPKQQNSNILTNESSDSQNTSKQESQSSNLKTPNNQKLHTKLQLENKLTIPKNNDFRQFNYKISVHCQSVLLKQSIKLQTLINQYGIHNVQSKYVLKNWKDGVLGGMISFGWNSHSQQWRRKWQLFLQMKKIMKLGNIYTSFNDKFVGFKLIKQVKHNKIQLTVLKKWNQNIKNWPRFGIKINLNL